VNSTAKKSNKFILQISLSVTYLRTLSQLRRLHGVGWEDIIEERTAMDIGAGTYLRSSLKI
jgi:hypothetical protein